MLSVSNITVEIKSFTILRGVSIEVADGEIVGLIGRNGAGKTTTLKSVMGLISVSDGQISLQGENLLALAGHQRAPLGIGYMPEERRLIGSLSVQDNIMMPAWACKMDGADERLEYIYKLMPEISPFISRRASMLSGGQQKMVALARALMSGNKILLLDEPFEGLAPALREKFGETIQRLKGEGLTILLAESDTTSIGFVEKTYMIERGQNVDNVEA